MLRQPPRANDPVHRRDPSVAGSQERRYALCPSLVEACCLLIEHEGSENAALLRTPRIRMRAWSHQKVVRRLLPRPMPKRGVIRAAETRWVRDRSRQTQPRRAAARHTPADTKAAQVSGKGERPEIRQQHNQRRRPRVRRHDRPPGVARFHETGADDLWRHRHRLGTCKFRKRISTRQDAQTRNARLARLGGHGRRRYRRGGRLGLAGGEKHVAADVPDGTCLRARAGIRR